MRYPIKARSIDELKRLSTPHAVAAGQSEAIPYVLFDSQVYTSAVDTSLTFFQTVQSDKTLGNMMAGGQLVADYYLELWGINVDVLIPASSTATGLTGSWADMDDLMWLGRPTFRFEMNDKNLGPFPCSYFHASGGVQGFGYSETGEIAAAAAAVAVIKDEYANWGIFDGGFWVGGSVIIPPQSGFLVELRWPTAVTLLLGNPLIRVNLVGTMHRNVL